MGKVKDRGIDQLIFIDDETPGSIKRWLDVLSEDKEWTSGVDKEAEKILRLGEVENRDARATSIEIHLSAPAKILGQVPFSSSAQAPVEESQQMIQLLTPESATKLLYLFMPASDRDAVIGDLEEKHAELAARFGGRYAARWYRFQALRTLAYYPLAAAMNLVRSIVIGVASKWLGP